MAVGDKSHLYAAAGLPVNTYVPSGQVNPHGSALNFSNAAGTNIFTGPHVGELGSAMNLSGTNTTVPIANPHMGEEKIGTYSTGIYTPTAAQIRNQANTDKYPLNDYSADYRFGQEAIANYTEPNRTPTTNPSGVGGIRGGGVSQASAPKVVLNQMDLSQRTPSGSMYAPDLSAYNDSSLFNYTGPGGLDEYTYGQNLPYQGAGYDIWGSPTDVPNPYFWGQFGEEPVAAEAQGPADAAINMSPITMPEGVTGIQTNDIVDYVNVNTGEVAQGPSYGGSLANNPDYQRVPGQSFSTTFPSPAGANPTLAERQRAQIGAENYDAMVAQANAWDNQMREGQLGSGFKGEEELNKDVQKTIFDSYGDEDAAFDAAGYDNFIMGDDGPFEYDDYLARDVAEGMGKNLQELIDKGNSLQETYDAFEAPIIQDNLFNQHFDRNQAEYTPSIRDVTDARPLNLANAAANANTTGYENIYGTPLDFRSAAENAITGGTVNTQHPAYQAMLDRQINEAENAFQMQGTGGLPDKGSYAGSSADLSGGTLNTQHPAYAAHQNRLENLFQTQGTEGLPNKGSYAGSASTLGGSLNLAKKDLYSADDRFRQTPQSIADVDYNARPLNRANAAANATIGGNLNMQNPAYQAMLDRQINEAENLFQNQDTGFPAETRGSFAGSSADLGGGDVTEGGKKGFSGKTASDIADIQNLSDSTGMSAGEIAAGTGVASLAALTPELIKQRNADISMVEKFIKSNKAAGSTTGYLTEAQWAKTNGSKLPNELFEKASGNKGSIIKWLTSRTSPAHFAPVEKAIKVGSKILPPLAAAGLVYGAGKGSYDLTNAAIDKLGVRDNLFDMGASIADSLQARKETKKRIETEKSEGTFKPRVVAENKAKVAAEAKAKKVEAEAKRKKGLAEAAAEKAKKAAAAKKKRDDEAARNAREQARRPTPKPKPKVSSPTSKGGRGSRGGRTKPKPTVNRWGKRYGGR